MAEPTAEKFAQRVFHMNLLDERQLDTVWAEFGTREVSLADFRNLLVRRELLTNFQVEKLLRGDRSGYYYGDYKVLYLVGSGTFARVYRAVHRESGRIVAAKVLRRRWSDDPEKRDQFLHEGQMGRSLRHSAIVPIYEVHSDRTGHYLTLEFVEGQSLRDFVKIRTKVDPVDATSLMIDVTAGLEYAFSRGITHRDLKLSNILVSSRGKAKLVDFGLATASGKMSDEALQDFPNPRTIDYAALERATGVRKDDSRSDVYFAGCIYYQMLTGEAPLPPTRDRIQRLSIMRFQGVQPIEEVDSSLPLPVVLAVNKAMDLNPKRRYQTPGEMLRDLKAAAERMEEAARTGESIAFSDVEHLAAAAHTAAPVPDLEGSGKTVMVIEAATQMQDLLRKQFKKLGYRVLVISDPKRAVARFEDDRPADCVLFCADKIGFGAFEAFNEFGRDTGTKQIPAVLLLGEAQAEWQAEAETSGHREALSMPLRMKQLRAAIQRVLQPQEAY